jgi:hypothetical protein
VAKMDRGTAVCMICTWVPRTLSENANGAGMERKVAFGIDKGILGIGSVWRTRKEACSPISM